MTRLSTVEGLNAGLVAQALADAGACRVSGFPDPAATAALREDLLRLREAGALREASVGHGRDKALRQDIRGDSTLWLDDEAGGEPARAFLAQLDALRTELNRRLFLGTAEVEAHYACYPPGAFYRRHRDRFRDNGPSASAGGTARIVTVVSYLNEGWNDTDGGAIRLYLPDGEIDVLPQGGSSVVFLSELEHEVLPATRQRLSIAAWMRRRTP